MQAKGAVADYMTQLSHPPSARAFSGRDVTAVLGPTNTGKTHLAIERLVAHDSGIIGLPLRLLAREVYGRICQRAGRENVALITGEEKIVPPGARYSVYTVEALPRSTTASFAAIDEVQLAGDLERGHTFTDRLLHLRGRHETLLLGSLTVRGILERLLPGISVVTRPRMSQLAYAGSKKITRLPRRSAVVAFSADEVYAIAELIRRQRGGAAVVLGALSPRTRNAQVELYQSGDVDYLVATDAIGMGLNLDLDHVGFAQNRKFDGYQYRQLSAAELGQIAGRAGRHVRDGTFGVTGRVDPFDDALVERIETHAFEPVKVLQWRNSEFDFSSLEALKRSIESPAPMEGLARALPAVDARALDLVSQEEDVARLADRPERIALLWDACSLPDYRRIAPAQHADIIAAIYLDLARDGHVDEDYLAEQVQQADRVDGEIDTLSARIAQIRTWTFVSNRPGWVANPAYWQERSREIEDRLSDALHEKLTKRFVDRRTSVLMKRLRESSMLEVEISSQGDVTVEGHPVGTLDGFRFTVDNSASGEDGKAVREAAQKALASEYEARAERFAAAPNGDLALDSQGTLRWLGSPLAKVVSSAELLKPRLILLADDQLAGTARERVQARAERYLAYQIETHLKPLIQLANDESLSGMAKGIAYRLVENQGILNRRSVAEEIRQLDQEARASLRRLGVRFGAYHIYLPMLIKPAPATHLTLLWALANDALDRPGFGNVTAALAAGRTSILADPDFEREFYRLAGYRLLGRRAVRIDILERLADLIRPALQWKPGNGTPPAGAHDGSSFLVTPAMLSLLGATADDMVEILKALGYRGEPVEVQVASDGQAETEARPAAVAETPAGPGESDAASDAPAAPVEAAAEGAADGTQADSLALAGDFEPPAEAGQAGTPAGSGDAGNLAESGDAATPARAEPPEPAAAARSGPDGGAGEATEPAEPAEPAEVVTTKTVLAWRPARSGNGRQGRQNRRPPKQEARKGQKREKAPQAPRPPRDNKPRAQEPRGRKPQAFDPDSPFAKLAELRERLGK